MKELISFVEILPVSLFRRLKISFTFGANSTIFAFHLKRFSAIFLFLCLTAPFWGSYLFFSVSKEKIRHEVKQRILNGIAREELVRFTFSLQESRESLNWKDEKEFDYQGRMYDIVETEYRNDTIQYWCYPDQRETSVNLKIKELVARATGTHPQNRETGKRLISFFQTVFLQDHFRWNSGLTSSGMVVAITNAPECFSGYLHSDDPPPENL
jgi:hypothetical protein